MILVIGNKRYSSWSLRPWLVMKYFNISFEEKLIPLDQPSTQHEIEKYSPSKKVPLLIDGKLRVWESLAIAEYLNEKYPEHQMWPKDPQKRALARAITHEMHAGFNTMRTHLPHDIKKKLPGFEWKIAQDDIMRIKQIWTNCLDESKGPYLFGRFSIADAMFAPVVNRFITYDVPIEEPIKDYVTAIRELDAHKQWIEAALAETFTMPRYTQDYPLL